MQKAIIVTANNYAKELNQYLIDGWEVVKTERFMPGVGGNTGNYTLGSILVILEKK